MADRLSLDALNAASPAEFAAALDGVFEHAPQIAERAAARRPFATVAALHDALMDVVRSAPEDETTAFLAAHPELAASNLPFDLTDASRREQSALGMADVDGAAALPALNRAYRDRFGIPFIVCVARHTGENVLRTLRARLARSPADEREAALDEVGRISRLRLLARVAEPVREPAAGPGARPVAGHLSSHVLDLQSGRPASFLAVALLQEGREAASGATDADGRITALLPPGPLRQGRYELLFDAGAYFAARSIATFYDRVPVRFAIDQAEGRYHIPLLLAPYGYSTYRGS